MKESKVVYPSIEFEINKLTGKVQYRVYKVFVYGVNQCDKYYIDTVESIEKGLEVYNKYYIIWSTKGGNNRTETYA